MNTLITGGHGMLGSDMDFGLKPNKQLLDLTKYSDIQKYIENNNITSIVHLAAKVGGVGANSKYNLDFLVENSSINSNILRTIAEYKIQKSTFMLSTCVFPANIKTDITESDIHLGEPHSTNLGYGHGKRLLEIGSRCLLSQYGIKSSCIIPCNMYGKNDNYNLEYSHVIPGLIHKCYLAKLHNEQFEIWGSGEAEREFLYSADMAKILKLIHLENHQCPPVMIVSPPNVHSISEIVDIIIKLLDFKGSVVFDSTKPEGAKRKTSNNALFKQYFPDFVFTDLEEGLSATIDHFLQNYDHLRK